ncbi:MAG: signal peptidase II [Pseudobdellovibrionaceae bacterium]
MKNREWFIVFIPLVLTWAVDFFTKQWASELTSYKDFGIVNFVLHHNPGAMLGLFADLPPILRVVSLSTGGAFLFCTYGLIQYLLPIKSLTLRTGLSILLGGILGNVTDRIIYGHVIDFIVFRLGDLGSPAFNLADALQWVGYGLIVYAIVKEGDLLWPEFNSRRKYWINPRFQLKYCFFLLGVGFGVGLVSMVFSYTYLRVTMIELSGHNTLILDKFLLPFTMTFGLIIMGLCAGLFTVGKIISHKIAGPLYAFEKVMSDAIEGKNRPFKLRSKDEFKHLEDLAMQIQKHLIRYGALPADKNVEEISAEDLEVQGALVAEVAEKSHQEHEKAQATPAVTKISG